MQEPRVFNQGQAAFGGGMADSMLHPVVAVALVIAVILCFLLPRRYVVVPFLLTLLLVPSTQNLYLAGAHFFVARILILFCLVRVVIMRLFDKQARPGLDIIDKLFLVWAGWRAVAMVLQFLEVGAIVNQAGFLIDSLGAYFVFRSLIRDESDIQRVVKVFAVFALIMAVFMVREQMTGQNLFTVLGGIEQTAVRNGRLRASGAFRISIIAGAFGAITFPLFLWLFRTGTAKVLAIFGAFASTVMTVTSASSTPVAAFLCGIGALCLWPLREYLRSIRLLFVALLVALQLVMQAPVWFIMARIDFAGGSQGWDRAELIDMFLRHFRDWWLIGTHNNVNWGWNMWDQCNQFVVEGEGGGLLALGCFIAMITVCFKRIGNARKASRGDRKREKMFWLLGVTMFVQVVTFFGIDYFDQSKFVWYALLVMVTVATAAIQTDAPPPAPELVDMETFWTSTAADPRSAVSTQAFGEAQSI
jgi:hypothetical protein